MSRRRSGADPGARTAAVEAIISARTTTWPRADAEALREVVASFEPSARHVNEILDWIDDIAARTGSTPATTLADPELQAVLRGLGSGPDRLKRWKERLRRLRFPRLAEREAEIAAAIAALDLGSTVAIDAPRDLEGGVVTVTMRPRSPAELSAAIERLRAAIGQGRLERLFALIGSL